jgi:RNA polymerase sigma factor (TIGR02999 family)
MGGSVMPRRKTRAEISEVSTSSAAKPRRQLDENFSSLYAELRRMAAAVKQRDVNATISTSTLVHEAWMKLARSPGVIPESELHFKRTAARVMRQIVMDAARRRRAGKRGGGGVFITLDDSIDLPASSNDELLRLDNALDALAQMSARQADMVELRFFGGLENSEIEMALGVSESTVTRDLRAAFAWLKAEIRSGGDFIPGAFGNQLRRMTGA